MNPYRLIVQCKLSESFFDKVVVALKRAVIRCNEMRYELGLDHFSSCRVFGSLLFMIAYCTHPNLSILYIHSKCPHPTVIHI